MSRDDDDDQELSGTDRDGGFVDRDDDGRRDISLTDSDDDSGLASGNPDPGFAAFADDFDDPLADWPGPEPLAPEKPETPTHRTHRTLRKCRMTRPTPQRCR
jgi:hypothetical protein